MRNSPGRSGAIFAALLYAATGFAHETDQYTVPLGRHFADLGPYFSQAFYKRIQAGAERANAAIRDAINRGAQPAQVHKLKSHTSLVHAVHAEFPSFVTYIEDLDRMVRSETMSRRYPGYVVAHRSPHSIYEECFPIDIRALYKLWRSATVMIDGTYLGTDKMGHFVHNGYFYYVAYDRALESGKTKEEAIEAAIELGAGANLFHSEQRLLGSLTSGVISNADLAANYAGFKFFLNLAEPVAVRGSERPAMLRRVGEYWQINDWVKVNSGFFTDLVTEHFDEVFNPNLYTFGLKTPVRSAIEKRCDVVLDWYTDVNGVPQAREFFEQAQERTQTYYGEDYGHLGHDERCVSIVDVCFEPRPHNEKDSLSQSNAIAASPLHHAVNQWVEGEPLHINPAQLESTDEFGRTPLHWAVRAGRSHAVERLLAAGADVNRRDVDGETPLHHAVRLARPQVVKILLQNNGDVDAPARYGTTPLHLAVRADSPAIVQYLIAHHASLDAADRFGCTALHDAAVLNAIEAARLLIAEGADVNVEDKRSETPLHKASRSGHDLIVCLLLDNGAESPPGTHAQASEPRE